MSENAVLSARDVHKSFGRTAIIQGVNLDIVRGERHALIGPNGAGKSTMFNLLSGILKPTSGEIRLKDVSTARKDPAQINRLGLARSFQITSIFPRLSVFENLRIGAFANCGVRFDVLRPATAHKRANEEAERLLDLVRLGRVAHHPAGELAYSDQRALELGLTLATEPEIILLDEPTAGMSREETQYAISLIRRVTEGRTLLIVEHDLDVVFSLADRISVLVYGQVIATGPPADIKGDAAVQEAYLGKVGA